jgi:hypothetical protein
MALDRSIAIDEDFEETERAQTRFSTLLRRHGPIARQLDGADRAPVWAALRDRDDLRKFPSSGLERFNHNAATLPDGRVLFVFQGEPSGSRAALLFLVWGSQFGVTFRAILETKHGPRQVALFESDPDFEALWSGRFVLAFIRLGRLEAAFELDYSADPRHAEALAYLIRLCEQGNPTLRGKLGAYPSRDLALAYSWSTIFKAEWTRSDWLQHGWIETCKRVLPELVTMMPELVPAATLALTRTDLDRYPALRDAIRVLLIDATEAEKLEAAFTWMLRGDNGVVFAVQASEFFPERKNAGPELTRATEAVVSGLMHILHAIDLVPSLSRYGRRQAYIDTKRNKLDGFDLDFGDLQLEADEHAQRYWLPRRLSIPYDAQLYLEPDDFPARIEGLAAGWGQASMNIKEVDEAIDHLIDESIALKKWTIPNRATVEIQVGPFVSVELTEFYSEIYFIWRTADGHYWPSSMNTRLHTTMVPPMLADVEKRTAADATIRLLMATLVRDFWVVEERHKVFDVALGRAPRRKGEPQERRIIYLPRVRYDATNATTGGLSSLTAGLDQQSRARHFVKYSFRKVANPSALQLALAKRERIVVPEEHTYVRPHYRGSGESHAIYRSRSAMQLVFEAVGRPAVSLEAFKDWFLFERMIGDLLEDHLGYEILQRSVRGRGDNGMDIVAIKVTRLVNELWIIQCKQYAPDNPIGPSVVRELLGSMTDIGPDAGQAVRGMIVSTSRFTPEAMRLAAKHGITMTDGDDLAAICAAINRNQNKAEPGS